MSAGDEALARLFPYGIVFAFDHDLRFLSIGGPALADVGLSREALEGRTIFEVFPPETCVTIEPLYRAALRGEVSTVDVPYGGRVFNQRLAPAIDHDGVVVAGTGFSQDVTDSRLAERALQESETRMRLTIDNAPIGEALVELDGHWRTVNPALCTLLGYSREELMQLTFQDITHPDDLDLDLELLHRLTEGEIASYEMEKRYRTAADTLVWVLLSVSLVRGPNGEPLYFVSQIVDITERKQQERALRDLTSMLGHDLRTPTTVIYGYAEIMISDWEDHSDADRLDAFRRIESAAGSMRRLLENSLTASALDGHGLRANPVSLELSSAVQSALAGVPHPGINVRLNCPDNLRVFFDEEHFTQVLANLITNAIKYGGDELEFSAEHQQTHLRLTLADNGPGVPAAFVPHLFDRFTRTEEAHAGRHSGMGLGLHIVRDLLALNEASIAYATSASGGAAFVLRLPLPPMAERSTYGQGHRRTARG